MHECEERLTVVFSTLWERKKQGRYDRQKDDIYIYMWKIEMERSMMKQLLVKSNMQSLWFINRPNFFISLKCRYACGRKKSEIKQRKSSLMKFRFSRLKHHKKNKPAFDIRSSRNCKTRCLDVFNEFFFI